MGNDDGIAKAIAAFVPGVLTHTILDSSTSDDLSNLYKAAAMASAADVRSPPLSDKDSPPPPFPAGKKGPPFRYGSPPLPFLQVTVLALGTDLSYAHEGHDATNITMPDSQLALVETAGMEK